MDIHYSNGQPVIDYPSYAPDFRGLLKGEFGECLLNLAVAWLAVPSTKHVSDPDLRVAKDRCLAYLKGLAHVCDASSLCTNVMGCVDGV